MQISSTLLVSPSLFSQVPQGPNVENEPAFRYFSPLFFIPLPFSPSAFMHVLNICPLPFPPGPFIYLSWIFHKWLHFVALQYKQYETLPYWLTVLKQCMHHSYKHKAAVHDLAKHTHTLHEAPELWRSRYCNLNLYSTFGPSAASANELSCQGNPVWKDNPFLIMWTDTFHNEMAQGCPCLLLVTFSTHIHTYIHTFGRIASCLFLSLSTVFQINDRYFTPRIGAHHAWQTVACLRVTK